MYTISKNTQRNKSTIDISHSSYTDDDVFRAAEMIYTLGNPAALPAARQAAREWERRVFWGMGRDFRRKVMRRVRAMRMMRAV